MAEHQRVDAAAIALQFNQAITDSDLPTLTSLMTDDHTFTDTEGHSVAGRDACRDAWGGFFTSFPGYRNVFTAITTSQDTVVLTGHSICSEAALDGPAIWTATIHGNQLSRWTVHEDTPQVRRDLGLPLAAESRPSDHAPRSPDV